MKSQKTIEQLLQENKALRLRVTALENSKNELQKVHHTCRQILDAIDDMVLVKGPGSRIVWANQAFRNYYGMTNEQLQDLIDAPFNDPLYTKQYLKDDEYVFTTGKILNIPEESVTRHDGTMQYFHTIKSPIFDAKGKVFRLVAVCRNITEEKQALEALRQSEAQLKESDQRLNLALDATGSGLWDWNIETGEVRFSRQWIASLGYSPDQVSYTVDFWKGLIHPDDISHTMEVLAKHLEKGAAVYECKNRLRTASGKWRWNRDRGKVVEWNAEGNPIRMVGTDTDISELKRAREEVKVLQRQEDLLLQSASEGIYGLDLHGKMTFVNPAAARMIGWDAQELIGQDQHAILHHSKSDGSPYPRESCPIYHAFNDGEVHSVDSEVFWRKDGRSFPVEYTSTPIREEEGNLVGAVVTFRDISERREAEAIIRKSEQQWRAIYEQAPTGIAILDSLSGQFQHINRRYCDIVGYSQEEMLSRSFQDITYPDDLQSDLDNMQKLLSGEIATFKMEKRYIRKDGGIIWVSLICVPLWLNPTDPRCHIAIVEDITERKQSEEQISEQQTKLRTLAVEVTLAEEHERKRIASVLHDDIGQNLALLKLKLGFLGEMHPSIKKSVITAEGFDLIEQIISSTRTLTYGLVSTLLYELGFAEGIQNLCEQFQDRHPEMHIQVQLTDQPLKLSNQVSIVLFRIIRELLFNIEKTCLCHECRANGQPHRQASTHYLER